MIAFAERCGGLQLGIDSISPRVGEVNRFSTVEGRWESSRSQQWAYDFVVDACAQVKHGMQMAGVRLDGVQKVGESMTKFVYNQRRSKGSPW